MDKALSIPVAMTALGILAGCATLQTAAPPNPVGIPCNAGPIILDKADQITTPTLRQIITLNKAGAKLCQWKKPGAGR